MAKTTVKYHEDWDFDTFLYKNYGVSHTNSDRSKAFAQFLYCRDNWKQIVMNKETDDYWETRRKVKEQREMDGDNSILGNPAY